MTSDVNWLYALFIALIISVAVYLFARWWEKKNHLQQMELLQRKREKLEQAREEKEQ